MAEPTVTSMALKLHTDLTTLREYAYSRDITLAVVAEARRKMTVIYEHLRAVEKEANMSPPEDLTTKILTPVAVEV